MTSKGIVDLGASTLCISGTAAALVFVGFGLKTGQPLIGALGVLLCLILNTAGIIRFLCTPLVHKSFRGE